MKMRGAKEAKAYHWICQHCLARWSRQPLADYEKAYQTEPDHKNLITFGKYTGFTFWAAFKDKKFVRYAKDKHEQEEYLPPGVANFVRYIKMCESITGGCASSSPWQHVSSPHSASRPKAKTKPKAKPMTRPRESHSIHSSPAQSDVDMGPTVHRVEEDDFEHVSPY